MAASALLVDITNCERCSEPMTPPIFQCQKGHTVCGGCSESGKKKKKCTICGSYLTKNHKLEKLISKLKDVKLKLSCKYANRGCKYELDDLDEKVSHELECKSRVYECEGKTFSGYNCDWTGSYVEILEHFKRKHSRNFNLGFTNTFTMNVNMRENFKDIQIIDFRDGQQLFWFKHKTDVDKKKAYWLIQYVGLRKQAAQYYYEFEIKNGIRKIQITEICESDCQDAGAIFSSGKCVALPFKTIRTYLNEDGQLPIRFRVMKMKKDSISSNSC